MSWIEIVLITIGMSLDTFAAVECQGCISRKTGKETLIHGSYRDRLVADNRTSHRQLFGNSPEPV